MLVLPRVNRFGYNVSRKWEQEKSLCVSLDFSNDRVLGRRDVAWVFERGFG